MSKFLYNELKPALNDWHDTKSEWLNNESQDVKGFQVGYYAPSGANWAYQVHSEILEHKQHGKVLAQTIRQFGQLKGVMYYRALKWYENN